MSRLRFGVLVAVLALVAGVGTFAAGVAILDDDGPDEPPGAAPGGDGGDAGGGETTTTPTSSTTAPADGPVWVAVVSSEGDAATAESVAAQVDAAGLPSGVLRSDDHESLTPGFWVAYAGPYASAAEAEASLDDLAGAGWSGAYTRCVGTADQCS